MATAKKKTAAKKTATKRTKHQNYRIWDVLEEHFHDDRDLMARSADISVQQLNNYLSQKREMWRLEDGSFVLVTSKTKTFRPK